MRLRRRAAGVESAQLYWAVIRHDGAREEFVISSPDFPELEARCKGYDEAAERAVEEIRKRLAELETQGLARPAPTARSALEDESRYRSCFLIGVEAGE
jgi:predicted RNase H-like HicB family nuclease